MAPMTRSFSIVLFGLLTLGMACGSSSKDSARDGGIDAARGGGSGTQSTAGGSGGGSPGSGGLSSGGGMSAGGKPDAGGGLASGGAGVDGGPSTGGSGGATSPGGTGGAGGRSTAGNTGGGPNTGGGTAGRTGTAGNTGSGGSQTGGTGGNLRVDGGPDLGPGPDAMVDTGRPDSPADLPQNADTGGDTMTLDVCFAGLPKPVGAQMVATKQSSDKRVRIRIALDTEDRMGTSGSYGWGVIRLAVEVDGVVTCIKDRANLKYSGSHHNCSDSATATSGSTTYSLTAPDRSQTSITISDNGATKGTWSLTDSACTMTDDFRACRSGGPC